MMEWCQGQASRALDVFAGTCAPWTVELQEEGE